MKDTDTQAEDALRIVMTWLHQLDTADSYQGFSMPVWVRDRPQDAINHLRELFSLDVPNVPFPELTPDEEQTDDVR